MTDQLEGQMTIFDLVSPSGKTYPEHSEATKGKISRQSSKRSVKSGGGYEGTVPMPPKGRWHPAGCIVGDGFSIAWRVYDAQYWGVPQRRKRIYLIADFGSERAGEILFECESVHGNPTESGETWQGTAADAEGSAGRGCKVCYSIEGNTIDRTSNKNGKGWCESVSPTLNTQDKHAVTFAIEGNGQRGSHQGDGYAETDKMYTLNTIERHAVCFRKCGGGVVRKASSLSVFENHSQDSRYTGPVEISQTVSATFGMGGNNQPFVVERKTDE